LTSLNQLDRRQHIEPFITSLTTATNSVTGEPITVADRIRRIHAVGNFLAEITEWGWDDAPTPGFRTDAASIVVLAAHRVDTQALAADAAARGWTDEADPHRRLLDRLDTLIEQSAG